MIDIQVIATCRVQGLHNWITQPESAPRKYLSFEHRHEFHIEVGVSVNHGDRDVEILQLKQDIFQSISEDYSIADEGADATASNLGRVVDFKSSSCEMIATKIIETLESMSYVPVYCKVLEDGENGALVTT